MNVIKANVYGNPNIGLYGFANNKYCLLGKEVPKKVAKDTSEILGVPVHQLNICGTSMVGIFLAGNDNCLLVPELAFEKELHQLDRLKIKYKVIKTKLTALGNNILCNNKGCLVNPDFSADTKKEIRKALNVPLKPGKIASLETVGSLGAANDMGAIVHNYISKGELHYIEELLKVKVSPLTLNLGNPYIRSAIIVNNAGFAAGEKSSGVEINRA
ncbi:MAG: translation initiation factor IF-6, partial [Candidatus Woesearchaeota archaeon]